MKRIYAIVGVILLALLCWLLAGREKLSPSSRPISNDGSPKRSTSAFFKRPALGNRLDITPQWPRSTFQPVGKLLADSSVEERMKLNDFLLAQTSEHLFELWQEEALRNQDELRLDFISSALTFQLRGGVGNSEQVLTQVAEYIRDASRTIYFRWHLTEMLGDMATPPALEILLTLARAADDGIQPSVLRQIVRVADNRWDGNFREELSPLLERAWVADAKTESLTTALAIAIAKAGTPEGVRLLVGTILGAGKSVAEFEASNNAEAWLAFDALPEISNPHAVPLLEAHLKAGQLGGVEMIAAGHALSSMGVRQATEAILQWAQQQSADVGGYIHEWLSIMRDTSSVELVTNFAATAPFANPRNGEQVRSTLAEWKAHRLN